MTASQYLTFSRNKAEDWLNKQPLSEKLRMIEKLNGAIEAIIDAKNQIQENIERVEL